MGTIVYSTVTPVTKVWWANLLTALLLIVTGILVFTMNSI